MSPHDIKFNNNTRSFEQEINKLHDIESIRYNSDDYLFNIEIIDSEIINSVVISSVNSKQSISYTNTNIPFQHNPERTFDIGTTNVILKNSFQSLKGNSDVFVEVISDRWYISIS